MKCSDTLNELIHSNKACYNLEKGHSKLWTKEDEAAHKTVTMSS